MDCKILWPGKFILVLLLFTGCAKHAGECRSKANSYILESPQALKEFLIVKKEILHHPLFIRDNSAQGCLFVNKFEKDLSEKYKMPHLKKWFDDGRGYINLQEEDTSCCYRECSNGTVSLGGYIRYMGKKRYPYKSAIEPIADKLGLGQGWYADVNYCESCGE